MKQKLLLICLTMLSISIYSQNNYWKKASAEKIASLEKFERANTPEKFELFSLNFPALRASLLSAPLDTSGMTSTTVVAFPDYRGKISNYVIYEAPVMEKGLSDKYPDIKSYVGKGIDDPSATIRFSTSLFGLHLMMTSGEAGTYYIDTQTKDLNNYIVYSRNDIRNSRTFTCEVEAGPEGMINTIDIPTQRATDGRFRQYRLAMACTIEYAAYHVNASPQVEVTDAEKKATVLAAMNVTMTRVNGIYEKDMSLRMNLVANNDLVIFINSDSFSNATATSLINESQTVIDANIGSANYDIGHTVSTGGGGLAQLNSPCTANKARGITGSPAPVGDPYDVDYVAHEMGHQFGGPHTFSGTGGSCTGNGSAANAVEPGSGSTIMAYAGICTNNVQPNSDPYFHAVSIASMTAFMTGTGNCAANALNNNNVPVIAALSNYSIPNGTAFVLTGSATDPDAGAALTYCWEQTNAASGTNLPTSTQTTGPIYRSLNPSTSPKRYFPKFSDVLNGNLSSGWEVTPTVARTINFALVVRDNQVPTGGQTARANMTVTTTANGPFTVTAPASGASWNTNSAQTITWNVANTTAAPISTANVNILLSTDNGVTFSTLLANTPNDGTQVVTMPAVPAVNCRILIEAVGNIFYAVSPNFSIGYTVTTTCNTYTDSTALPFVDQAPGNYTTRTLNVPMTGSISSIKVRNDITHTYLSDVQTDISSPAAPTTFVKLLNRSCGNTNGRVNMNFVDGGGAINCAGGATLQNVAPSGSLASFNSQNPNGNWTFRVYDNFTGDTGTVNTWAIEVCTQVVALSTESFGIDNFGIFPNPNNGTFTVKLTSNSANKIKVGVHDLRGRLVFENDFQNTGTFNQEIQLGNVQSGIYLVTVQDGDKKEVKKIVVE
ncbi:T9SS type A sorting domain-containing protein [Flavobacterium amnicola]|uniref:T9SS type A sorting domain-containing protein n=1 Tax=Flavobacterium amnicola TaxID=2506422 RepID=A0A4Q1K9A2_9FLAO|nr:zinc-dependent metalloprotease family protein [Flavobacterium amnicola]RXR21179.1 T9SS type A sorting domain-containing protein [Flavobacterium amnicola]